MSKKILILDDDENFNSLLTDVFTQADYDVHSVTDPRMALETFKTDQFNLVVTDHRMPNMTGAEFVRKIKGIRKEVPVVMVSGYLDDITIRGLIQDGVDGIFIKPLNIIQLLKKTSALIGKSEELARNDKVDTKAVDGQVGQSTGFQDYKHNLSFEFNSYPCSAGTSRSFAQKLYGFRDFKSTLILFGERGLHFDLICKDLCGFSDQIKEELIVLDHKNFDKAAIVNRIMEKIENGVERVTLVAMETPKLTLEEKEIIFALARSEPPFDGIKILSRYVFCLSEDLDSLYDKGELDENLYVFLGNAEIEVPPLRECANDIPVMAQRIVIDECNDQKRKVALIDEEGKLLLKDQHFERNYTQLSQIMKTALTLCEGSSIITTEILKQAIDFKGLNQSKYNFQSLKDYLKESKNEIIKAVLTLSDDDKDKAARTLGVSPSLIKTIDLSKTAAAS